MKRSMVVSLIGRPNVGKSSIFNRLMRSAHKAITFNEPGVTRDRHYGVAKLDEYGDEEAELILVDTGGFYPQKIDEDARNKKESNANKFFNIMADHAQMAIEESDLVLFIVDIREGALPFDETIADYLRTQKKEFWLVINKYDSDKQMGDEVDFYSLGLDPNEMLLVSAEHGIGLDDLRKKLYKKGLSFNADKLTSPALQKGVTPSEEVVARVALIGAPNAGKSTLLNNLIGAKRALVSDIPGTTVDPIEGYFDLYFGRDVRYLQEKVEHFDNNLLVKEYESFRKNNLKTFESMVRSYESEEEEAYDEDMPINIAEEFEELQYRTDDEIMQQVFISEEDEEDEILEASEDLDTEFIDSEAVEQMEVIDEGSFWKSIHLVDTAGIRKQKSVKEFVESQSVYRSLRCITESDIVIYMVDATKGISHQDRRLLDIALEKGKSVVIALNKIDLLKETLQSDKDRRDWIANLRIDIPWLDYCDMIPISAKYGKGVKKLKKVLKKTIVIRNRKLPTGEVNRFIYDLVERHSIVVKNTGGKRFKVKYSSMVKTNPPTFLLFSNRSRGIPDNYRRYLQNHLRGYFELDNTPVHLIFRTGSDLAKRMKLKGKDKTSLTHTN